MSDNKELPPLVGSEWGPVEQADTFVRFGADGSLMASAGCNALSSTYEQTDNLLLIKSIAATRKMCPPDVMTRETALVTALENTTHAAMRDDGKLGLLVLKNYQGRPLMTLQRRDWD